MGVAIVINNAKKLHVTYTRLGRQRGILCHRPRQHMYHLSASIVSCLTSYSASAPQSILCHVSLSTSPTHAPSMNLHRFACVHCVICERFCLKGSQSHVPSSNASLLSSIMPSASASVSTAPSASPLTSPRDVLSSYATLPSSIVTTLAAMQPIFQHVLDSLFMFEHVSLVYILIKVQHQECIRKVFLHVCYFI